MHDKFALCKEKVFLFKSANLNASKQYISWSMKFSCCTKHHTFSLKKCLFAVLNRKKGRSVGLFFSVISLNTHMVHDTFLLVFLIETDKIMKIMGWWADIFSFDFGKNVGLVGFSRVGLVTANNIFIGVTVLLILTMVPSHYQIWHLSPCQVLSHPQRSGLHTCTSWQ